MMSIGINLNLPAVAMQTGLSRLSATANNLANLSTPGFRASSTVTQNSSGGYPVIASTRLDVSSGGIRQTGQPLDLAIEGDAFFAIQAPDGSTRYTRDGSFQVDSEGYLAASNGDRLSPPMQVPAGATDIQVSSDGTVMAAQGNLHTTLGQIASVRFNNPSGLAQTGDKAFVASAASGEPMTGNFMQPGYGRLTPGALAMSNTDVASDMVSMMLDQRFVQMQVGLIGAGDELMEEIVNLKRPKENL